MSEDPAAAGTPPAAPNGSPVDPAASTAADTNAAVTELTAARAIAFEMVAPGSGPHDPELDAMTLTGLLTVARDQFNAASISLAVAARNGSAAREQLAAVRSRLATDCPIDDVRALAATAESDPSLAELARVAQFGVARLIDDAVARRSEFDTVAVSIDNVFESFRLNPAEYHGLNFAGRLAALSATAAELLRRLDAAPATAVAASTPTPPPTDDAVLNGIKAAAAVSMTSAKAERLLVDILSDNAAMMNALRSGMESVGLKNPAATFDFAAAKAARETFVADVKAARDASQFVAALAKLGLAFAGL